jgi:hypothetical protein
MRAPMMYSIYSRHPRVRQLTSSFGQVPSVGCGRCQTLGAPGLTAPGAPPLSTSRERVARGGVVRRVAQRTRRGRRELRVLRPFRANLRCFHDRSPHVALMECLPLDTGSLQRPRLSRCAQIRNL